MKKSTPKQKLSCREYRVDLNGAAVARWAGYSKKTADRNQVRGLQLPQAGNDLSAQNILTEKDIVKLKFQISDDIVKEKFASDSTTKEKAADLIKIAKSEQERAAVEKLTTALQNRLNDRLCILHQQLTGVKTATFAMLLERGPLAWSDNTFYIIKDSSLNYNSRKEKELTER